MGCMSQMHWTWSSAAWGEADDREQAGMFVAGWGCAPITHQPLLDILFVSTSICTNREPIAVEKMALLSQKQLAEKQHIKALSNPPPCPLVIRSLPYCSLSLVFLRAAFNEIATDPAVEEHLFTRSYLVFTEITLLFVFALLQELKPIWLPAFSFFLWI